MKHLILGLGLLFTAYSVNAQSLPPTSEPGPIDGDYRTQTIGGWGATPSGNNPGVFLHENFDAVFPTGIEIGSGDNTILFTNAQAITDYLPGTGTPRKIKDSYIDPTKREVNNTFISQILALTISLGFDAAIADFAEPSGYLGDLILSEGALAGKSVSQVLDLANRALSGSKTGYSISELNEALSIINENYVDGEINNGFLSAN